ncbi:hypothetical protein G7Y89_g15100 [Cudoniella acicularis]|uniref:TauD/TfdA-like domain-containing protein n=1 Tax=Cudoniella acicularis TaxID=354080 RepID=A0A8H4QTS8_9HELO|nr:hypothetical protein G7Y89_g15100 [Cudoniella acicularis]
MPRPSIFYRVGQLAFLTFGIMVATGYVRIEFITYENQQKLVNLRAENEKLRRIVESGNGDTMLIELVRENLEMRRDMQRLLKWCDDQQEGALKLSEENKMVKRDMLRLLEWVKEREVAIINVGRNSTLYTHQRFHGLECFKRSPAKYIHPSVSVGSLFFKTSVFSLHLCTVHSPVHLIIMSPSRILESTMAITPIKHSPNKKCTMGATITGLDLNNITDEDLATLKDAVHQYQYAVIKDQHNLDPVKQWELVTRLDPEAPQVHGHGTVKEFSKVGGLLSKRVIHGLPAASNVRLIGKGYQGDDHFGIKNHTAEGASNEYHRYPPSPEAFTAGNTQFQRWHIDAPLYDREPPHFTTLRAINDEEKILAENSWVEYAPFPYMWIENCKGRPNGLGLETEGLEHKMKEMPGWDEKKIKRPMVWLMPTGQRALQVHGIAVRKMFLKATPTSEVKVVDDVEIRKLLHS